MKNPFDHCPIPPDDIIELNTGQLRRYAAILGLGMEEAAWNLIAKAYKEAGIDLTARDLVVEIALEGDEDDSQHYADEEDDDDDSSEAWKNAG